MTYRNFSTTKKIDVQNMVMLDHKKLNEPSFFFCVLYVSIWQKLILQIYFTIQFIFAIIYGSYCIFMSLTVIFQLILTFIYSTLKKKIQFQQNK